MLEIPRSHIALVEFLDDLPESSGVYKFIDSKDCPSYIGKAKNIKKRVKSYYSKTKEKSKKIKSDQNGSPFQTLEQKLQQIKELRSDKMITEAEYQKRKQKLLNSL